MHRQPQHKNNIPLNDIADNNNRYALIPLYGM